MDVSFQMEIEEQLRYMNTQQLRSERANIDVELKQLKDQISDLAFNNYRTYADAGRTTQDCTEIFTELSSQLKQIAEEVPDMTKEIKEFFGKASKINEETELVKAASNRSSPLWDLISLPSRMDMYIRAGYYEAAYTLTNYGMTLQQHAIVNNPLVKTISDRMIEARGYLLEELFNKFAGPIDLAAAIQVVNNVRKIPFLSATQLRVSVLQYRDIYLEKQILDISTHPEFALKAIEIYKDCMYDTMVLYLAVFPENEFVKKDPSVDPRWEMWPSCSPSGILGEWATRNIQRLFDIIERAEMKSSVHMSDVWSSLMTFASSFGRMGLDFRPIVVHSLTSLVQRRFRATVKDATARLHSVRTLEMMSGGLPSTLMPEQIGQDPSQLPTPSTELSIWDDVCVYGNAILEAINNMKYSLSPVMLASTLAILRESLSSCLSWLVTAHVTSVHLPRAIKLLGIDLVQFLNKCLLYYFPYETIGRLYGSKITKQQYTTYLDLNIREMIAGCDGNEKLEQVLLPILNRPRVSESEIDALMAKKEELVTDVPPTIDDDDALLASAPDQRLATPETGPEVVFPSNEPQIVVQEDLASEATQSTESVLKEEVRPETADEPAPVYQSEPAKPRFSIDSGEKEEEEGWGWGDERKDEKPAEVGHDSGNHPVGSRPEPVTIEVDTAENKEWGWGEEEMQADEGTMGVEVQAPPASPRTRSPALSPKKKGGKAD